MNALRLILVLISAAALWVSHPATLAAQYEGCVDVRGIPVYSQVAPNLQDVAMAAFASNGAPVIYYNPYVLSHFSPTTRAFWYLHECGHHALGHAFRNIPQYQEQEADCFAIVTLVQQGRISLPQVQQIQAELSQLGPGDWQHLPGPMRAINLIGCLQNAGLIPNGY